MNMDPEKIDYSECAPERDEVWEAYVLHLEQEVLKLDGICTCDEDRECDACRTERLAPMPPIVWTPERRRVALTALMRDEVAIEAEIDDRLAERAARKMPVPARPYTPRYAFGRRLA